MLSTFLAMADKVVDKSGRCGHSKGKAVPTEMYRLPCSRDPRKWAEMRRVFTTHRPSNAKELHALLTACHVITYGRLEPDEQIGIRALAAAITWMETNVKGFRFYQDILPRVLKWAADPNGLQALPVLKRGDPRTATLSTRQARHMLSLAFLLALPGGDMVNRGSLSFHHIFASRASVGAERVKCLLHYLYHEARGTYPSDERIEFERVVIPTNGGARWAESRRPLPAVAFSHRERIEDMEAGGVDAIVDFANKRLQIFRFIPSATQEEVQFSCRPALKLAMLIAETLRPDEALLMRGARPYSDYSGYLSTFQFKGDAHQLTRWQRVEAKAAAPTNAPCARPPEVIAIDAIVVGRSSEQYGKALLDRDLDKAWVGFGGSLERKAGRSGSGRISTGLWGCGVFNGDPVLKYLQQAMAAAEVQRSLNFSTFGNKGLCHRLEALHRFLTGKKVSVSTLYALVLDYHAELRDSFVRPRQGLDDFLFATLGTAGALTPGRGGRESDVAAPRGNPGGKGRV